MTDLERYCVSALRLSEASAEAHIDDIRLRIEVARAELIRSGVPKDIVIDDENKLVVICIIDYVISEMDSIEAERARALEAFKSNMENLRKSVIENA